MCQQFTNASSRFSSRIFPKTAFEIHPDRVPDAFRKTAVLISVQPNQQIWLTLKKFVTHKDKHFVNVRRISSHTFEMTEAVENIYFY